MHIDTSRDLQAAGLITCWTCAGTGEVEVRASDVIMPVPCPDCAGPEPAWIDGHDDYPDLLNDMREEDRHGALQNAE